MTRSFGLRSDTGCRPTTEGLCEATEALVVSSTYVHLRTSVFVTMFWHRLRTLTVFGELLSQLLQIGGSAVRPRSWSPCLTRRGVGSLCVLDSGDDL
jgi:hypothetical protein